MSLSLDPRPENAAVARHAVSELAASAGLADPALRSAEVVVTEAFTNATRHAYPEGRREPVEVSASAAGDGIEIAVRDRGAGFRPRPVGPHDGGRLGLLLIAAVADSVRLNRLPQGGTELFASVSEESASHALGR